MPAIARDAWPVVLVDHSMEFPAPIGTIAKLCRRIIGISGRHKGREERQMSGRSVFMPFLAYQKGNSYPIKNMICRFQSLETNFHPLS